jgi:hypothetical protein
VLFEWLVRSSDRGAPAPFVDQAEERVLWVVEGSPTRTSSLMCRGVNVEFELGLGIGFGC